MSPDDLFLDMDDFEIPKPDPAPVVESVPVPEVVESDTPPEEAAWVGPSQFAIAPFSIELPEEDPEPEPVPEPVAEIVAPVDADHEPWVDPESTRHPYDEVAELPVEVEAPAHVEARVEQAEVVIPPVALPVVLDPPSSALRPKTWIGAGVAVAILVIVGALIWLGVQKEPAAPSVPVVDQMDPVPVDPVQSPTPEPAPAPTPIEPVVENEAAPIQVAEAKPAPSVEPVAPKPAAAKPVPKPQPKPTAPDPQWQDDAMDALDDLEKRL